MAAKPHTFRKTIRILVAFILTLILYRVVITVPDRLTWAYEQKLAQKYDFGDEVTCRLSPKGQQAWDKLVARLYPLNALEAQHPIHVRLVGSDEDNAFTYLAGDIYFANSLLKHCHSPEEAAAIIAHEIGHVTHRDSLRDTYFDKLLLNSIGSSANIMRLKHHREVERRADYEALKRLQASHVSNQGFLQFLNRVHVEDPKGNYLSDHPSDDSRIAMTKQFNNENTTPVLTADEWQALMEDSWDC